VRAGRYTLLYAFDATNASGSLPLAVRGQDIVSRAFSLDKESASSNELVQASWTIGAAIAGPAILRTWVADAAGTTGPAGAYAVDLVAGANALVVDLPLTGLEPGAATAFATLELPDASREDTLAQASAGLLVRGFAVRDARVELGDGLAYDIIVDLQATPATPAHVVARTADGQELALAPHVDGRATYALPFVAPEGGTYAIDLRVTAGAAEFRRSLTAMLPGEGTPPTTTLTVEGPTWLREDGVLVMSAAARLVVTATDVGSGVASTTVVDEEGVGIGPDGRFAPGLHNLTYSSRDHAGHKEPDQTLRILVDGEAPALQVLDPYAGDVHIAGALVAGAPRELTVMVVAPGDLSVAIPAHVVDTDGDGFTDADELVEGSDPEDGASTPARYMPAPMPVFEKPVIAIGALRVVASAPDEGAGIASIVALLDEREVATSAADAVEWTIDLAGEAAGDHVLTIVATDAVGNARSYTVRVQVLPTAPEGLAATDPNAPRLHPFAFAVAAWLTGVRDELPGAAQDDLVRRQARVEALERQVDAEVVQPLTPTALDEAPAQLQRDLDATMAAVDEIVECCVL
jgi:hypothetical protein